MLDTNENVRFHCMKPLKNNSELYSVIVKCDFKFIYALNTELHIHTLTCTTTIKNVQLFKKVFSVTKVNNSAMCLKVCSLLFVFLL